MKTLFLVSVVLVVAFAAPTKDQEVLGSKREKKSASYGPAGPYGSAPAPASSPYGAPAGYGYQQAPASSPISYYMAPAGPSPLHYRADSHLWDGFMPTDTEEHMQARSYSPYGAAAGAIAGGSAQAVATGPALGLFPNANIGGCAVPLLVSCAPSISRGQIMKSPHSSYAAPSYAYRNMDFDTQMRMNEEAMQMAAEEQAQWSNMERAVAESGKGHMHQHTSDGHTSQSANGHYGHQMHLMSQDASINNHPGKLQAHSI